jgi:hypothetical protein
MAEGVTNIAGIEIPSADPIFLAVVGVHILLGLACTVTGVIAMLSQKRAGHHPRYGTIYFWCLAGIFLTASCLAASRWAEDYLCLPQINPGVLVVQSAQDRAGANASECLGGA